MSEQGFAWKRQKEPRTEVHGSFLVCYTRSITLSISPYSFASSACMK